MKDDVNVVSTAVEQERAALVEGMVAKISTDVDQAYIYPYEKSKFVPPDGKVLLIMGQDLDTVSEYTDTFPGRPAWRERSWR